MIQMFILIMVYLNLITCFWIRVLHVEEDIKKHIDAGQYDVPVDTSRIEDQSFIPLPEKLKFNYQEYYDNEQFQYMLMFFMNLFNILGNDISPTKLNTFWVSTILMFTGLLVVGNLIGEFSNILNEIYEADFNNEIEEHQGLI